MNRFVQIEHRERRRRLIARLQEWNQKLHEEIILNEQITEELIDEPEPEQQEEEYYADSVEDTESFEIASVDIIEPPLQRIPYVHSSYKPRAGTGGPQLAATVVARERENEQSLQESSLRQNSNQHTKRKTRKTSGRKVWRKRELGHWTVRKQRKKKENENEFHEWNSRRRHTRRYRNNEPDAIAEGKQ